MTNLDRKLIRHRSVEMPTLAYLPMFLLKPTSGSKKVTRLVAVSASICQLAALFSVNVLPAVFSWTACGTSPAGRMLDEADRPVRRVLSAK